MESRKRIARREQKIYKTTRKHHLDSTQSVPINVGYKWVKFKIQSGISVTTHNISSTTLASKTQESLRKRWKDSKSQRNGEFVVRLSLLGMLEATPIYFHQHDCLSTGCTWTNPINTLTRMGECV